MDTVATMCIFTIGHSNVPAENVVALLQVNGIAMLVDVRSMPYSQYTPQFNKDRTYAVERMGDEGVE